MGGGDAGGKFRRPSPGRRVGRPATWIEYSAFARVHLGIRKDEFFSLQPRALSAMIDQHTGRIRHEELLFGQVVAGVINFSSFRPKRLVTAKDFMPSQWGHAEPQTVRRKARATKKWRQEVADSLRQIMAAHNAPGASSGGR